MYLQEFSGRNTSSSGTNPGEPTLLAIIVVAKLFATVLMRATVKQMGFLNSQYLSFWIQWNVKYTDDLFHILKHAKDSWTNVNVL